MAASIVDANTCFPLCSPLGGGGLFDPDFILGHSPLQDSLFMLGSSAAFDLGLFRDKSLAVFDGIVLEDDIASDSDGVTAGQLLPPGKQPSVDPCEGQPAVKLEPSGRMWHVASMQQLQSHPLCSSRMHASCPCFLDMAMHHHDNEDGILPGSTHIELLDTEDEGGSSSPLENFPPTDSTGGYATSNAPEYGEHSLPSLQISGHSHYAYARVQLPSRTVSPTTDSMQSGQSVASVQTLPLAGSCRFFGVANSEPASAEAAAFASCGTSVLSHHHAGVCLPEQQRLPPAASMLVPTGDGDVARRAIVRPRRATSYVLDADASEAPQCPLRQVSGKKRGSGTQAGKLAPNPNGHACTACGAQSTPVWRAGPQGPKTLCNACGVRYMKVAKKK